MMYCVMTVGDTPQVVIDMIISCWDKDRSKRKTSPQCVSILGDAMKSYVPTSRSNVASSRGPGGQTPAGPSSGSGPGSTAVGPGAHR